MMRTCYHVLANLTALLVTSAVCAPPTPPPTAAPTAAPTTAPSPSGLDWTSILTDTANMRSVVSGDFLYWAGTYSIAPPPPDYVEDSSDQPPQQVSNIVHLSIPAH